MSSLKSQVAVATNIPTLTTSQSQKDYSTEEPLGRQNSFGNNRRGNMKGKHLTRSHAMRESTSPPRTPTPRAADHAQTSPNGQTSSYQHHHQPQQQHADGSETNNNNNNTNNNNNNNNNNSGNSNNKLHAQSMATRGSSPIIETPAVIVTSQHNQQQQQQQQQQQPQQQQPQNVALCNETEFPKLTPPKSTKGGGGSGGGSGSVGSGGQRSNNSSNNSSMNSSIGSTNCNGTVDCASKIEFNNNNNNNNNKKLIVDLKASGANGAQDTHKNNNNNNNFSSLNNNNNNSSNSNNNKHQQYNATNALHQALNVGGDAGVTMQRGNSNNNQQQQQQQQTPQSHYNSGMNYQLNAAADGSNSQHHHQPHMQHQQIAYDKENRCPRNDSQSSNISNAHDDEQQHYERVGGGSGSGSGSGGGAGVGGNKKHRTNSNSKSTKPRLKNISSSSGSVEGSSNSNNTSGFISRENSNEQFTDHGGTDLLSFFKETLNKSMKDRNLLLKIEKELIEFVQDKGRSELRFPSASSYHRMLIHRTAAFFGMEHNVDTETQQCVIVATTKSTRIPEIRFKSMVRDHRDDTRKSILKRDTHSFDDSRQSGYLCPERGGMLDRKAKSFEEREEDYERARSRIFNRSQMEAGECVEENYVNMNWSNSAEQQQLQQQQQAQSRSRPNGKMLKMQTTDGRDGRSGGGAVPKAHSFGGYGGGPPTGGGGGSSQLLRGDSANSNKSGGARAFNKQDSAGSNHTPWRLSPSSSGYKTQTQSVHSDSVTPSPTSYGSDEHTPEPSISTVIAYHSPQLQTAVSPSASALAAAVASVPFGLVWAVTDITNVPKGSVLINPHTLQPILNQDGSIYHFDPSNLPPSPVIATGGGYHQSNQTAVTVSVSPQPQMNMKRNKAQQMPQSHQQSSEDISTATTIITTTENMSEMATQTVDTDSLSDTMSRNEADGREETCQSLDPDECDNAATSCLSITTTISTKNYDRIEVQKFKNQATSPNIPNDAEEASNQESDACSETNTSVSHDPSSRNQAPPPPVHTPTSVPQPSQAQQPQQQQTQHRETPHSARSTPFSNSEHSVKRVSEEPKATTWTYTQSYQAPDGSTVFHTTTTPNGTPYCATTYQQGPDGSVYAIPQGMVYAYPPPVDGEVQGYFMPVFDPTQQRADSTGLIPAGTQAVYPTAGGATTMVPLAATYPTATQFATSNGATAIYPGQVIYSSEQFTPGGPAIATPAAPAGGGQLQQIPMTTYPIGYPYPYNGYWGQTMTYYVPQQTLTNAVAAAPLLPAPPPPPTVSGAAALAGPHVAGGMGLSNGLITATAAAGPTSNSAAAGLSSGSSSGSGHGVPLNGSAAHTGSTYQAHNGTTYFGTGRIKRHTPAHYAGAAQSSAPLMTAIPSSGGVTTTYQLGHAVPTLTLAAAPASAAAASNDLNASAAAPPTATMYALPQHATLFPANMFPYAAAATGGPAAAVAAQSHAAAAAAAALNVPASVASHTAAAGGVAHAPQPNPVIAPFYAAQHPHSHPHPHATVHAPGPAAIPIVDPATMTNVAIGVPQAPSNFNASSSYGGAGGSSTSQSAPSTPHSLPSATAPQRNPPLFSTPPILGAASFPGGSGSYSTNTTPQYYNSSEPQGVIVNSQHNPYMTSHDKRNNHGSAGNKKPSNYANSGGISRQSSNSGPYNGGGKPPLLGAGNGEARNSPNNGSNGYQPSGNARPHALNKRNGGDKSQAPLLSGPPSNSYGGNVATSNAVSNFHAHHAPVAGDATGTKPPMRLNAAAASFRQKPGGIEYRRSVSQRNSPGTNSSSNEHSNNNSPNSIAASSSAGTPITNCYTSAATPYMNHNSGGHNNGSTAEQQHVQPQPMAPTSLYITTARGAHIPPQMQHGGALATAGGTAAAVAAAGSQQAAATAAVLGGAAAAAAAALGNYGNPGTASGVYFKYGQTYFAHPSVALPNSRRSPSTDLRPPLQMTGMYPTVNMMIPAAPPRHAPGRHPNPNYKGTRPR